MSTAGTADPALARGITPEELTARARVDTKKVGERWLERWLVEEGYAVRRGDLLVPTERVVEFAAPWV